MKIDPETGLLLLNGGGGEAKYYECASVGTNSWSGYEWKLTGGEYVKSTALTSGLKFGVVIPLVGQTYADGALVRASMYTGGGSIPEGVPTDGLCAWYTLARDAGDAMMKHPGSVIGNLQFTDGYATGWSTENYIKLPAGITGTSTEWTFGYVLKKDEDGGYDWAQAGGNGISWYDSGTWHQLRYGYSEWSATAPGTSFDWQLISVINSPSESRAKLHNNSDSRSDFSPKEINLNTVITLGGMLEGSSFYSPTPATTKMKHAFFYNKALTDDEYSTLYNALLTGGHLG